MENEIPNTPESLTGPQALHAAEVMRAISERETVVLPREPLDVQFVREGLQTGVTVEGRWQAQAAFGRILASHSSLLEAVTLLRELAERMDTDNQTYWANALREILDTPSLVAALKTAGGSK